MTPSASAASVTPERKTKRPDNERRKTRRVAWRRRCAAAAAVAAAATSAPGPAMAAAAGAVPTEPGQVQPAATAAATPPRAWALEKRDGLIVIARRVRTQPPESPETTRASEGGGNLNISFGSWAEERKREDFTGVMKSSPTYAAVAGKAPAAAREEWTEEWSEEVEREERAEPEPTLEAKRCPACLSSNTNPEKNKFSDFIRCNFCHTVH